MDTKQFEIFDIVIMTYESIKDKDQRSEYYRKLDPVRRQYVQSHIQAKALLGEDYYK